MNKAYSESFKTKVIGYINKGHTIADCVRKYGVTRQTIMKWRDADETLSKSTNYSIGLVASQKQGAKKLNRDFVDDVVSAINRVLNDWESNVD